MTLSWQHSGLRTIPTPRSRVDDLAVAASAYWRFRRLMASDSRSQREHALEFEWAVVLVHEAMESGIRAGALLAALAEATRDDDDLAELAVGPLREFLAGQGVSARGAVRQAADRSARLRRACSLCPSWVSD